MRDELLGIELLSSLAEAKVMVEDYNERPPALGARHERARPLRPQAAPGPRQRTTITLGDPAQGLRGPQNGPISIPSEPIEPD
jgi:hypothetical protein